MKAPAWLATAAGVWIAVFVGALVVVPVGAVLQKAFAGGLSLAALTDPLILEIARATVGQALLSTLIAAAIGLPLGLACGARVSRHGGGGWIRPLLAMPYGVPTVVAGLAGVAWLGRSGLLARVGFSGDLLYTFTAVIIVHVFLNAPWIALRIADARAQVPAEALAAARTLGAGPLARYWFVVHPYAGRALAAASAQVFGLCATSFALILLLGGGPPVETLETAIYSRVRSGAPDFAGAAVAGAWQLLITLLPWAAVLVWQAWRPGPPRLEGRPAPAFRREGGALAGQLLFAACAIWVVPYLALLDGQFGTRVASPEFWSALARPAAASLALATGATFLALTTAAAAVIAISRAGRLGPWISVAVSAPAGISVLVVGLGVWLAYGRWIDPFTGSLPAMIGILGALFVPIAFRTFWSLARGAQQGAFEAARTLGASPWRAFWAVEWPRLRPGVLSTAAVVAGAAIGEVSAVSLFYSENLVPLPLLITRWTSQYRFADAQAVAAMLCLLSAGTITAVMAGRSHARG